MEDDNDKRLTKKDVIWCYLLGFIFFYYPAILLMIIYSNLSMIESVLAIATSSLIELVLIACCVKKGVI